MSMNIRIYAEPSEKPLTCDKCGHTPPNDPIHFDVIQTPTDVTYAIYYDCEGLDQQLEKYKEYVRSRDTGDEYIPYYAADDIFGEGEVLGYHCYNWSKEHIEKLDHFIEKWHNDKYRIVIDYI